MTDLSQLKTLILNFRNARDWKQFHTPRNLAESLVLESGEVLEHFQWKTDDQIIEHLKEHKEEFSNELADVFNYLLLLAHETDIDLVKAVEHKIKISEVKYPVEKSKSKTTKYTKL
jgi:NTP pyrophosphatase (non-canonical NTP hydrolase)